jgi:hypothetical protein
MKAYGSWKTARPAMSPSFILLTSIFVVATVGIVWFRFANGLCVSVFRAIVKSFVTVAVSNLNYPCLFESDHFVESGLWFHPHCMLNLVSLNSSDVGKFLIGYVLPTFGFL